MRDIGREYFDYFRSILGSCTLICDKWTADAIVDAVIDSEDEEFYMEYTEAEIMDILENNDCLLVTRNTYEGIDAEWFIEGLKRPNGVQPFMSTDYVYVEMDVKDEVDFTRIEAKSITIL